MTFARYAGAFFLSFATAFLAWVVVGDLHPIFHQLSLAGLVPWFVAG